MKIKRTSIRIILLIALIKLLFLGIFLLSSNTPIEKILYSGDTPTYIQPIDNLLNYGTYFYQENKPGYMSCGGKKIYAGRMPYYGLIYLPFRLFFSQETSFWILMILQIIIDIIATYFIYKIIILYIHPKRWFSSFIIFILSSFLYISYWSIHILPESFALSFLIFFSYYYFNYLKSRELKKLLNSSIFLALAIVLKPYWGVILLFAYGELLIYYIRKHILISHFTRFVKESFVLGFMLFLLLTPWTIRNYIRFNKFIPLQEDVDAGCADDISTPLHNFINVWGSPVFWDPYSAGSYFYYNNDNFQSKFKVPKYVYCSCYGEKEIENLRREIKEYQKKLYWMGIRDVQLGEKIANKLTYYTECFKKEKPFLYYIFLPALKIKEFFIHSGSYYYSIPKKEGILKYFFLLNKLYQSFLYYVILIPGLIGIFLMLKNHSETWLFLSFLLFLIILFPIILKRTEWRYLTPAFIYFNIGAFYLYNKIIAYMRNKQ